MANVVCKQCGGEMKKTVVSSGNCTGIIFALIVFIIGAMLLFLFPPIGTIIGVLLMIMALGMGGTRRKVWKCKNCSYIFDRS
jgi:hypothetical protein